MNEINRKEAKELPKPHKISSDNRGIIGTIRISCMYLLNWFLSIDWVMETMVFVTDVPMLAPMQIKIAD